jgi:hypothetical protein
MSIPPAVPVEACVLCGTVLGAGTERCPACDLWVGVDGPGVRRPLPRRPLLVLGAATAAVWFATLAVAAVVG